MVMQQVATDQIYLLFPTAVQITAHTAIVINMYITILITIMQLH